MIISWYNGNGNTQCENFNWLMRNKQLTDDRQQMLRSMNINEVKGVCKDRRVI